MEATTFTREDFGPAPFEPLTDGEAAEMCDVDDYEAKAAEADYKDELFSSWGCL